MAYTGAMNAPVHFQNGSWVSEEQLSLSPRDLGFSRGYAVFDFLKTYPRHRPFKLQEHLDRLFNSARLIGLQTPWTQQHVRAWVLEGLERNNSPEEKFIKIFVSGGVSNAMAPVGAPTIVILIDPAVIYPAEQYEKGVGIITDKHDRYSPGAKTNNYIEGVKQTQLALQQDAVEPLYYSDAQVYEGSNSNIFAVIRGSLVTPQNNLLPGITRNTLLDILQLDIPVKTRDFTLPELLTATEVFYTGSGKEITPITRIDSRPVGNGEVGPITKEVMNQFRSYTLSDSWKV